MEMAQRLCQRGQCGLLGRLRPEGGHDPHRRQAVGRRGPATEAARGLDLVAVFDAALQEAVEALEETPKLLDVLGEAGVVDAGGEGFVVCLQGALAALQGKEMAPQPVSAATTCRKQRPSAHRRRPRPLAATLTTGTRSTWLRSSTSTVPSFWSKASTYRWKRSRRR